MNWFKVIPSGFLLITACAGFPFPWRAGSAAQHVEGPSESEKTPGRVRLEFQDVHYDGETLAGRLLIGVEEGRLRLNRQLHPDLHLEVRSPVDCKTGLPVRFIVWDGFPPRRKEDLLILDRGYWFGRAVDFSLFDEHFTGLGPECLKAEIWLFSFDGVIAARQEIRAERSLRQLVEAGMPEAPPDAGTQE
jgi:hypothetical protein